MRLSQRLNPFASSPVEISMDYRIFVENYSKEHLSRETFETAFFLLFS